MAPASMMVLTMFRWPSSMALVRAVSSPFCCNYRVCKVMCTDTSKVIMYYVSYTYTLHTYTYMYAVTLWLLLQCILWFPLCSSVSNTHTQKHVGLTPLSWSTSTPLDSSTSTTSPCPSRHANISGDIHEPIWVGKWGNQLHKYWSKSDNVVLSCRLRQT